MDQQPRRIAYFSMEIGLDESMPTYSGGLGILAGDTVRSAADLRVPMVGVTLLHRKGYFRQHLDENGWQTESPAEWKVESMLEALEPRAQVCIEGRKVVLRAWRYAVQGVGGFLVPVYLLDAELPENAEQDRRLTDHLYGGDQRYRLSQEIILGMGGVRMLRALGYREIERFHLNEGHASLLTLELLAERAASNGNGTNSDADIESIRRQCVFTTHTPVPAGHDQFPMELVREVLRSELIEHVRPLLSSNDTLNMTLLALKLSRYVNGVAKRHGEVSRQMFAEFPIDSITNGVHGGTWAAPAFRALFDQYMPGWREDNFSLRYALSIPRGDIWAAHRQAKSALFDEVQRRIGTQLDVEKFTIGFARRATPYKRADLLISDIPRLTELAATHGPFQIVYAGKAHPRDTAGKALIQRIVNARSALSDAIKLVYLENYNIALGKLITSGVDVWLNTPQSPLEASGTSGMKAALNGIPSLSVLDGWWIEGCIEGVTGWAIGEDAKRLEADHSPHVSDQDAAALYAKLDSTILPMYRNARDRYIDLMRNAIALNGSFFNTQRMVQEYVLKAYFC